jgi:signal transduction histidine kinase
MSLLSRGPRGLTFKLALFYIALSLPTLLLVEWTVFAFEFRELMASVDRGRLAAATEAAANDLQRIWPHGDSRDEIERGLSTWAESLVLQLERPRQGLSPEASYVLTELSTTPIAAALVDAHGQVLARAPREGEWQAQVPTPEDAVWLLARNRDGATSLPGTDTPQHVRRVLAAVRAPNGDTRGFLLVELRLPPPWRKLASELSFEWPILIGYLLVFGIASSLFLVRWVTRRLNHIADAATAWSRGDFSTLIADDTHDELGRLSHQLNRMAQELKSLMAARAQLATLEERGRLARDLHDTVKQKAFALNLQINAARRLLDPPQQAAAPRLDEAARLTAEIQRELAGMLAGLRGNEEPRPLLAARLRDTAERWARLNGLELELALDEGVHADPRTSDELLRITEEALANTLRHSGAHAVHLALGGDGVRLALCIADDGVGGADDAGDGMGLSNMRSRAETLREGRFELESAPGAGTAVKVSCRYKETAA